jgi:hypothetical protein
LPDLEFTSGQLLGCFRHAQFHQQMEKKTLAGPQGDGIAMPDESG